MKLLLLLLTSALLTIAILPVSLLVIATFAIASIALLLSQHGALITSAFLVSFTFVALPASFLILLCLPVVILILGLTKQQVTA